MTFRLNCSMSGDVCDSGEEGSEAGEVESKAESEAEAEADPVDEDEAEAEADAEEDTGV